MRDLIRVLIVGTGQMGAGIARLLHQKQGLALVGACARRPDRAGIDLGRAIGLGEDLGIAIDGDLDTVIRRTRPEVAIHATCSKLDDAWDEIATLLRHGVSVISIAEEMTYPACRSPSIAEEMHRLALTHGAAVVGTGINPGFVFDLLVITLTGVCAAVDSVAAERINDLSPYGPTVLAGQGVGLAPEAFRKGVEDGSIVGHIGFAESIHLVADALGWEIERIVETREPILSKVRRETSFVTVEPGQTAGCLHTARAYRDDKPVITLIHPQQVHPHLEGVKTGDRIEIKGTPDVCLAGSPEIPGGVGTAALAVNMIPRILNAKPGLHTMADFPAPVALLGDVRNLIRTPEARCRHD